LKLLVLALVATGCNQIYGLDGTQLRPEVPVTGRLLHRWVENAAGGTPVVRTGSLADSYTVYLGARVGRSIEDVALDSDGNFSFVRASETEPYQLVLTLDGEIVEIQHDAPELAFVVRTAGRLDSTPITDKLDIRITSAPGTERAAIASTGIWAYAQKQSFPGAIDFDWQAIERADRPGLLEANRGDVFYYMDFARRTTPEGQSYLTVDGAARVALTLTPVPPPPFSVAPRVVGTACAKLVGAHAADVARFQAATPGFFFLFDQWRVMAIPDRATGTAGAIDIAFGEAATFTSLPDIDATPLIYNPIEHTQLAVAIASSVRRYVQHPSASLGDPIDAYMAHVTPLSCGSASVNIIPPAVGLPGAIALDDTALDVDGVEVMAPVNRDLELTWETVSPGRTDWYTVVLYEVFETFNFTGRRATRSFQTAQPRVVIDPASLVRGRYYVLEVTGFTGFPDAASGNLDTIADLQSAAVVYSSMFRVR
jgi:hypothetical protein